MKKWLIVGTVLGLALAGCSDPKKASKENFQKAIQTYYDGQKDEGACIRLVRGSVFSEKEKKAMETADLIASGSSYQKQKLDGLVAVGLLKLKEADSPQPQAGQSKGNIYAYVFTDEGKKYLVEKDFFVTLCTGHPKVTEILQYSEPSDMMGMTFSKVKYKAVNEDIADWAKNPKIRKEYNIPDKKLGAEYEEDRTLILMNDGWKVDGK